MKNDQRHTDAETEPGSTNPSMHLSRGCFQEINSNPPVDLILIDYRFVSRIFLRISLLESPSRNAHTYPQRWRWCHVSSRSSNRGYSYFEIPDSLLSTALEWRDDGEVLTLLAPLSDAPSPGPP